MDNKHLSKNLKNFIEENIGLIEEENWKELFSKIKNSNASARELAHTLHIAGIPPFNLNSIERETKNLKLIIYTNDNSVLSKIEEFNNRETHEFYSGLIDLMKQHHCYTDVCFNDCYDDKAKSQNTIFILIDKEPKNISNNSRLEEHFEKYSKLFLKTVTDDNATWMDLFFMLSYHTVDKIEFKPKDGMRKLVDQSLREFHRSCVHGKSENENEESLSSCSSQKDVSELMGCYIDASNQNCSIEADNNIVYLCDENIKEFSKKFKNISEEIMFELVFCHELGHLVFSYLVYYNYAYNKACNCRILLEGQANFFASYVAKMIDESYIEFIKAKTQKQPIYYRFPILITDPYYMEKLGLKE